ncbi:hypothetical protein MHU86_6303 [Fragilaria crotonensis]|nr:hypothetical protein MHU86_6303 [Fragilaria crotonensis]
MPPSELNTSDLMSAQQSSMALAHNSESDIVQPLIRHCTGIYLACPMISSSRDNGKKVVDHHKDSSKQNEFSLNDTDTADTLSYAESIRRLHGLSSEDTKILLMGLHHGLHGTKQWQQMYVMFPETLYVDEAMGTIPETSASHYFCDA